jgi:hypothetical protein
MGFDKLDLILVLANLLAKRDEVVGGGKALGGLGCAFGLGVEFS